MHRVALPVLALLALSLLAATASAAEPSKKIAEFLGADAVEILKAPEKVECCRVVLNPHALPKEQFRGAALSSHAKDQDAAFGGTLATLVFDEKTYDFTKDDRSAATWNRQGVGFRVRKGGASADVIVNFDDNTLSVITGEKDKNLHTARADSTNARAALVALAKAAFPDDKTIQALK